MKKINLNSGRFFLKAFFAIRILLLMLFIACSTTAFAQQAVDILSVCNSTNAPMELQNNCGTAVSSCTAVLRSNIIGQHSSPYIGGAAVYEARGLLELATHTVYNDRALCATQGIAYRQQKPQTAKVVTTVNELKAYPNPANNYLVLRNTQAIENATVLLTDVLGRTVLAQTWQAGASQVLNTETLNTGIYSVRVTDADGAVIANTKITISH
jgi:Secretion system C-terminal sorting domain